MIEGKAIDQNSRARRLKAETAEIHERLDSAITAHKPFASVARYRQFLAMQHRFHAVMNGLYSRPSVADLLPDGDGRGRLNRVIADMADLDMASPAAVSQPKVDDAAVFGWLYVAEGSNLGAAFLLKEAEKLGLSETHGARHLAGAPEGRGLYWRRFTAALDGLVLSGQEEVEVVEGAKAAFAWGVASMEKSFGSDGLACAPAR